MRGSLFSIGLRRLFGLGLGFILVVFLLGLIVAVPLSYYNVYKSLLWLYGRIMEKYYPSIYIYSVKAPLSEGFVNSLGDIEGVSGVLCYYYDSGVFIAYNSTLFPRLSSFEGRRHISGASEGMIGPCLFVVDSVKVSGNPYLEGYMEKKMGVPREAFRILSENPETLVFVYNPDHPDLTHDRSFLEFVEAFAGDLRELSSKGLKVPVVHVNFTSNEEYGPVYLDPVVIRGETSCLTLLDVRVLKMLNAYEALCNAAVLVLEDPSYYDEVAGRLRAMYRGGDLRMSSDVARAHRLREFIEDYRERLIYTLVIGGVLAASMYMATAYRISASQYRELRLLRIYGYGFASLVSYLFSQMLFLVFASTLLAPLLALPILIHISPYSESIDVNVISILKLCFNSLRYRAPYSLALSLILSLPGLLLAARKCWRDHVVEAL